MVDEKGEHLISGIKSTLHSPGSCWGFFIGINCIRVSRKYRCITIFSLQIR
jgi:hypothetical protein